MKILGVIPARFASTRFPGKPLAKIGDKTMIQRCYEQCLLASSLSHLVVATDHPEIFDHVESFGGNVVMTSEHHTNGTERANEVLTKLASQKFDAVINIQGDEPFIQPEQIELVASLFTQFNETEIATLVKKIEDEETLFNHNTPKVTFTTRQDALYFSRNTIPYQRDVDKSEWLSHHEYYKHIGIYGYKNSILKALVSLQPSSLELTEKLEQLRWLENGYKIKVAKTQFDAIGIDTPEDLAVISKKLASNKLK